MTEPPNSQRSATRAPVDKPIRLQFDDALDVDEGHCLNISIGGVYVHTDNPRPAGTLVRFELLLSDEQTVRGLGEVVWQQVGQGAKGVGIKFRFLEQRDRQLIFKMVSSHIKARLERDAESTATPGDREPRAPEAAAFSQPTGAEEGSTEDGGTKGSGTEDGGTEDGGTEDGGTEVGDADDLAPAITADDEGSSDEASFANLAAAAPRNDFAAAETPATTPMVAEEDAGGGGTANEPAADATTDARPAEAAPGDTPGLFDRWQEPSAGDRVAQDTGVGGSVGSGAGPAGETRSIFDAEPAVDPSAVGAVDEPMWRDPYAGAAAASPDRGAGGPDAEGTALGGPRRRRDPTLWVAAALILAVAVVGAYVFRERLFSGFLGGATDAELAPVDASAAARPAPPPPASAADVEPASAGRAAAERAAEQGRRPNVSPGVPPAASPPPPSRPTRTGAGAGSTPAEPLPVDRRSMRRLLDIVWQAEAERLVVTLTADGAIAPARVKRFRLSGTSAREVVVLTGVERPFDRQQMPVGEAGVASVRTGFHRKAGGTELHVVLDLEDDARRLLDVRHRGARLELVVGR